MHGIYMTALKKRKKERKKYIWSSLHKKYTEHVCLVGVSLMLLANTVYTISIYTKLVCLLATKYAHTLCLEWMEREQVSE